MSRCRSCGAEITWCKTVKDKSIPIERVDAGGNLTYNAQRGVAYHDPEGVWVSHFAVCPQADEWRKK